MNKNIILICSWLIYLIPLALLTGPFLPDLFASIIGILATFLIIKEKCCHIIASDAHNDSNRNFCIKDAYNYVKNIIGKENSDLLVSEHPRSIINGEDLYF